MADELEWRGASVRGLAHRFDGVPRQDDFAVHYDSDRRFFYCVVADGVSGAIQSHIASTIAVRFALQWLELNVPDDPESTNWEQLTEHLSYALIEQASTLFGSEATVLSAEKFVSTTLVCGIVDFTRMGSEGDATAHIFSIGDSGVFVLNDGGFNNVIGGKDIDAVISSSAVRGLPRIPNELQRTSVRIGSGDILLLGTDGFSDPLGNGTGELGDLFRTILLGEEAPPILEFAHALDFSRSTFDDDRTLVAVWPRQQVSSCD